MTFLAEYDQRCQAWSDISEHLPALYELGRGKDIIELGVRNGNSTSAFLAAVQFDGGHVWSVDIDQPHVPEEWFTSKAWTFIQGHDCDAIVLALLPESVDVVFIDTSHAYDHTVLELETYLPRVKPGGRIVLHDTEVESPEGLSMQPPFPVKQAVREFCADRDLTWTNYPNCNGLAVVEV